MEIPPATHVYLNKAVLAQGFSAICVGTEFDDELLKDPGCAKIHARLLKRWPLQYLTKVMTLHVPACENTSGVIVYIGSYVKQFETITQDLFRFLRMTKGCCKRQTLKAWVEENGLMDIDSIIQHRRWELSQYHILCKALLSKKSIEFESRTGHQSIPREKIARLKQLFFQELPRVNEPVLTTDDYARGIQISLSTPGFMTSESVSTHIRNPSMELIVRCTDVTARRYDIAKIIMHTAVDLNSNIGEMIVFREVMLETFSEDAPFIYDTIDQCLRQIGVSCMLKAQPKLQKPVELEPPAPNPEAQELLRASMKHLTEAAAEKEKAMQRKREEGERVQREIDELNAQARANKVRLPPRPSGPHKPPKQPVQEPVAPHKQRAPRKQPQRQRTAEKRQAIARQEMDHNSKLLQQVNRKLKGLEEPKEHPVMNRSVVKAAVNKARDRVVHSEVITTPHVDAMMNEMKEFWCKEKRDLEQFDFFWQSLLESMRDPSPFQGRPTRFAHRVVKNNWNHTLLRQLNLDTVMNAL